jgi:hypothetical protein
MIFQRNTEIKFCPKTFQPQRNLIKSIPGGQEEHDLRRDGVLGDHLAEAEGVRQRADRVPGANFTNLFRP